VFEPAITPEIPPADSECNFVIGIFDGAMEIFRKLRGYALIRVDVQHPRIPESDIGEPPILMRGPIIKVTLRDVRACRLRNVQGSIRAVRVKDVNIVGPPD
jgi:hypothetical protein